jgi:hypothetical protein
MEWNALIERAIELAGGLHSHLTSTPTPLRPKRRPGGRPREAGR